MFDISENKALNVYKVLLMTFYTFSEKFPLSEKAKTLDLLLATGKKCLPKDNAALSVIAFVMGMKNCISAIQTLLNSTFDDLPEAIKPIYIDGDVKRIAYWKKGEAEPSDRIFSLFNLANEKNGNWTDAAGNKVELEDSILI